MPNDRAQVGDRRTRRNRRVKQRRNPNRALAQYDVIRSPVERRKRERRK
jgi:hypothetical protein